MNHDVRFYAKIKFAKLENCPTEVHILSVQSDRPLPMSLLRLLSQFPVVDRNQDRMAYNLHLQLDYLTSEDGWQTRKAQYFLVSAVMDAETMEWSLEDVSVVDTSRASKMFP